MPFAETSRDPGGLCCADPTPKTFCDVFVLSAAMTNFVYCAASLEVVICSQIPQHPIKKTGGQAAERS